MKKSLILVSFFATVSLLSSCFIFKPQQMIVEKPIPLTTVFGKVLDQYQAAKTVIDNEKGKLIITEADVVFDNVVADELNASLSLLIFKGGYTRTKTRETTVTYSLTAPPETPSPAFLQKNQSINNPNALRDLIISAYNQFVAVTVPAKLGHFSKDVEIDISITVDQNGNFEVSGPIGKVGPDVTLSRDVANKQTVVVKFNVAE